MEKFVNGARTDYGSCMLEWAQKRKEDENYSFV